MVSVLDYFAYKRSLQFLMFFVMTFLLTAQGHTVSMRNVVYKYPEILWKDNIKKSQYLSRPRGALGYIYARQGDYPKAIKETEMALQLSRYPNLSQLVNYHVNLGAWYFQFGNYNEMSLFHYNEALRIHPKAASQFVYEGMAVIMLNRGNLKLAHEYGQRAIVHAPNSKLSYYQFALILLKEGNLEGAIKAANKAVSLDPGFINPLGILGEAYRLQGNYARSEYYWNEFLNKEPNNINALLASLELYHLLGKKEELLLTMGKVLSLSHKGDIVDMIKNNKNKYLPYTPDPQRLLPILQKTFLQLAGDSTKATDRK
jgi:tetratricopeptide (TPR) repeat protein